MSAGYIVRVEADMRDRARFDDLYKRLAVDESPRLLSAGYDNTDAPLAVRLLCAGTEDEARGSAEAAVTTALRSLGVEAAATVVEAEPEPERQEGPPWLALVEVRSTRGGDEDDGLLEALLEDRRIHGGSASVSGAADDARTALFAVGCPRGDVEDVAVSIVSSALQRAGVEAGSVQLRLVFHPDGGPA